MAGLSSFPDHVQAVVRHHIKETRYVEGPKAGTNCPEFAPFANLTVMMFANSGLVALGEPWTDARRALHTWCCITQPDLMHELALKPLREAVPAENLASLRRMQKNEFFKEWMKNAAIQRANGLLS